MGKKEETKARHFIKQSSHLRNKHFVFRNAPPFSGGKFLSKEAPRTYTKKYLQMLYGFARSSLSAVCFLCTKRTKVQD